MKSIWLGLTFAVVLGGLSLAAPAGETTWYVVRAETGTPIGYASRTVAALPGGGRTVVDRQDLYVSDEEGGAAHRTGQTVRREDAGGRTVSISDDTVAARLVVHTDVTIDGGFAEMMRKSPNDRRAWRVALPPGVRFDVGEGLLAGWDPAHTPVLRFDSFNLDAGWVEQVSFEVDHHVPAPAGGALVVLRKRHVGGQLMAISRLTLDARHHIVSVSQPMFGAGVTIARTDQATATAPHPPYHALPVEMVKAPYRIPPSAMAGHIRYRFGYRGGLAFPLPQTGEQTASASDGGLTLDVCDGCGPGLATDLAGLDQARRPTRWLQSDNARIRALAHSINAGRLSDARKMELLTELTGKLIPQVDFSGHFSAVETLERGASDCFGAAVLLAALGRAAGVPTKVADGLVYTADSYHGVSNAFMPHSWVLAYVGGRWKSYDAGVMTFDATHIAINVGDGDEAQFLAAEQLAGLLTWDGMAEVRSRS